MKKTNRIEKIGIEKDNQSAFGTLANYTCVVFQKF